MKSFYDLLKIVFKFFNCFLFFSCNLVSVNKGYFLIFESPASKIWFACIPKLYPKIHFIQIKIIEEIFLRFSYDLYTKNIREVYLGPFKLLRWDYKQKQQRKFKAVNYSRKKFQLKFLTVCRFCLSRWIQHS